MARRFDILSPSILAGFVAFCLTLDPVWFLGVSAAVMVVLFGLFLIVSAAGGTARSEQAISEGYPAE